MDAIEGLSAIGSDEPVETVALCYTFHQFTGGHEGSIHCHDEGKTGQRGHDDPERNPVEEGRIVGNQITFVLSKIDRSREGQGSHHRSDQTYRDSKKDICLPRSEEHTSELQS